MKNSFSIIVAVDEHFGIGKNGGMPWNLPGDMKHFKEITLGRSVEQFKNVVIMGRKTWESIPERFRPLPGRLNLVLSRDLSCKLPDGVLLASNFDQALQFLDEELLVSSPPEIFVIGGAEIFKIAINHPACNKIYITHIQEKLDCDRFFPPIPNSFKETVRSEKVHDGNFHYFFSSYQRDGAF